MRPSSRARRAIFVRRPALGSTLGLLALLLAAPASAQQSREDELRRWVPAISFAFDMLGHKANGAITTNNVMGPPLTQGGCTLTRNFPPPPVTFQNGTLCPDSPFPLTTGTSSSDTDIAPLVVGSLELSTPRLFDVLFSPRLFVHGDVAGAFGFERNLAGERKPADFFVEPLDPINRPSKTDYAEGEVAGQGSRAKLQLRPFVYGAGGGIAFTTTIFGRTVRLKPSFEYLREEVDLIASVHRAVMLKSPARSLNDFRLIDLHESSKETLHGLGGGIELEIDASRLGPLGMSLFLLGRGYRFTGNLRHTLSDTNEFGESATWQFELEPWTWRAGVGVRFRWLPD
jgi:hypothetical protein